MKFTIQLKDLSFYAIIGILEHERKIPQKIIINATITYEDSEGYIDYAKMAADIKDHIKKHKFGLLEEALTSTSTMLKAKFPQICTIELTISKPQILPDTTPSVSLFLKFD